MARSDGSALRRQGDERHRALDAAERDLIAGNVSSRSSRSKRSLKLLADYLGADTILWATDYPHLDGFWGAAKMIKKMGMPPRTEAAVLAGGAKRFYNLH